MYRYCYMLLLDSVGLAVVICPSFYFTRYIISADVTRLSDQLSCLQLCWFYSQSHTSIVISSSYSDRPATLVGARTRFVHDWEKGYLCA